MPVPPKTPEPSLAAQLRAQTAQGHAHVAPHVAAVMEEARVRLEASGLKEGALAVGSQIPPFVLPDATGISVDINDMLRRGPVVLVFYRGGWCPYCNLALRAFHRQLAEFTRRGATLAAISPQTPDASMTTKEKAGLDFPVLSDVGNKVARSFGLVFQLDPEVAAEYRNYGLDLEAYNGDASNELPVPATYLVNSDGTVLQRFLETDARLRVEPATVLDWLDQI